MEKMIQIVKEEKEQSCLITTQEIDLDKADECPGIGYEIIGTDENTYIK